MGDGEVLISTDVGGDLEPPCSDSKINNLKDLSPHYSTFLRDIEHAT